MREDREDLIGLLTMMYGPLPAAVSARIDALDDMDQLSRLILVAANSRSLAEFVDELDLGAINFRILSPTFEPKAP